VSSSLLAVVVDCHDPGAQARFWGSVLSTEVTERNPDEYLVGDPDGGAPALYLMRVPEPKIGKNRLHLDLVTEGPLEEEIQRLTDLGARLVEVRQDPPTFDHPDTWAVLEDPEEHVFCLSSRATLTGWGEGTSAATEARSDS
jgi:hypothetical protein